jgi:SseB protein N-terminal domain
VVQLSAGDPRFRADHGGADPSVATALAEYAAGTGSEHAALIALAGVRLLVPVVAVLADQLDQEPAPPDGAGGEKASEMAMPTIVGRDGRRALPAFTCLDALQRWQPEARPVPVPAAGVWQPAVKDGQAVIIDIAGPVPIAIEGARLAALASGEPVPPLHEDPDVRAVVAAAAAQSPGIRIRLGPPNGEVDFTLELVPADPAADQPISREVANALGEDVAARLARRASRGFAVVVRPPGRSG